MNFGGFLLPGSPRRRAWLRRGLVLCAIVGFGLSCHARRNYIPLPFTTTARHINFEAIPLPRDERKMRGRLLLRKTASNGTWKHYRIADGLVPIPAEYDVKFEIQLWTENDFLFAPRIDPNDLQAIEIWFDYPESQRQATDALLGEIAGLTGLEELDIYANEHGGYSFWGAAKSGITDAGVKRLAGMKKLRRLHLTGLGITEKSIPIFEGLQNLEWLELTHTRIPKSEIEALRARRPKLEVVTN